ncbi:MAG: hypothetical protein KME42_18045 [Tildeniella nuda ZEHNDER 1965/U140]|jgi:hypothetical protein|nr:hypothetical protein [Tildeniella nuda ZEHNDER 1965/U140]
MVENVLSSEQLHQLSTEALKHELLRLTKNRDTDPLSQKVQFFKDTLEPLCKELSTRNPFTKVEEQIPLVIGAWTPIWSTIPFQDTIPGRLREQSYQIFHADGYYANVARYAPGKQLPLLNKMPSFLFAYDFLILQNYQIVNGHWYIQNVAIKQKLRFGHLPLSVERAEAWFNKIAQTQSKSASLKDFLEAPDFQNLDRKTAKRFATIFKSTPQLEHLYIDPEFRLVKSQREAKQRPSYTVTVRLR